MLTPVYIKMDALDQLLPSEGICRQLGIVTYHKDVCTHKGKLSVEQTHEKKDQAKVSTVAVNMMQTVHLLPHQSIVAQVKVEPGGNSKRTLLVECGADLEKKTRLLVEDS